MRDDFSLGMLRGRKRRVAEVSVKNSGLAKGGVRQAFDVAVRNIAVLGTVSGCLDMIRKQPTPRRSCLNDERHRLHALWVGNGQA
jgi:hypothetical protein